jgi:hypothetical protein
LASHFVQRSTRRCAIFFDHASGGPSDKLYDNPGFDARLGMIIYDARASNRHFGRQICCNSELRS